MKLGVIYTEEVHNACYRALWPGEALGRRGHDIELLRYDPRGPLKVASLMDRDVVHVYRSSDQNVARAVDALRARGVAIAYDNDDDVRLAPKEMAKFRDVGGANGQRTYRSQVALMRRADAVSTTTAVLADRFGQDDVGPIAVIPNHLAGLHFARGPRDDEDGVVVGWFAGREHEADSRRLQVAQMLRRVMERRPEVRVVTMGVRLDLDPQRYTHHPYIPLHQLFAQVRRFDIGIAPLSDIPMSYARSDIKVEEYAAAGVPWIASARGSYASLGSREGGLVVDDDGWENALVELVASRWRRAQLRRKAEKWAKSQHIDRHVDRWTELWESAAARSSDVASAQRRTASAR
jgi:glycosyltransferase involved in cell wall biosynthesis